MMIMKTYVGILQPLAGSDNGIIHM